MGLRENITAEYQPLVDEGILTSEQVERAVDASIAVNDMIVQAAELWVAAQLAITPDAKIDFDHAMVFAQAAVAALRDASLRRSAYDSGDTIEGMRAAF